MNIQALVLAAGEGRRFSDHYNMPKPLVMVKGKQLIRWSVDSFGLRCKHVFLIREEHDRKYLLGSKLRTWYPGCTTRNVAQLTEGAACTAMLGMEHLDMEYPLFIYNCDQKFTWNPNEFLKKVNDHRADGGILTFQSDSPKWSYVRFGNDGYVGAVVEKQVVSNTATVGVYYWAKAKYCLQYIQRMIDLEDRFNEEFYLAPSYTHMIDDGARVITYDVQDMTGLGDVESVKTFEMQS